MLIRFMPTMTCFFSQKDVMERVYQSITMAVNTVNELSIASALITPFVMTRIVSVLRAIANSASTTFDSQLLLELLVFVLQLCLG